MNSSAPIAATPRQHADGWSGAVRVAVAGLLLTALFAVSACTAPRTRAPVASPVAKPPRSVATRPVPAKAPKPSIAVPAPAPAPAPPRYEQDKRNALLTLGQDRGSALSPSEVGYYMDVLQGRLKQLSGKNFGVARRGDLIVLVASKAFEADSTQLDAATRRNLMLLAKVLVEYRKTTVAVRVGGDDSSARDGNVPLANERGLVLADYLAKAGVTDKRIVVAGMVANRPATAKAGPGKHARIELLLEPILLRTAGER